jgi:hypothetical protein
LSKQESNFKIKSKFDFSKYATQTNYRDPSAETKAAGQNRKILLNILNKQVNVINKSLLVNSFKPPAAQLNNS